MCYSNPYIKNNTDIMPLMLVVVCIDDFILLTVSFLGVNVVIERDN